MRTSSERRAERLCGRRARVRAVSAVPSLVRRERSASAEGGPRERVALGTLDFTAAVTSLDGAQGERVYEYES